MNDLAYSKEEAEKACKRLQSFFLLVQSGQELGPICEGIRAQNRGSELEIMCFDLAHSISGMGQGVKEIFKSLLMFPEERKSVQKPVVQLNATYAKATKMTFKEERELAAKLAKENIKLLFSMSPMPPKLLTEINWERIGLCHHIPGGEQSSGIFVMQVGDNLVTVKPGSISSPGEYFCFLFYKMAGLKVPMLKTLAASDSYNQMVSAITKRANFTSEEVQLSFPFLMKTNIAVLGEFIANEPLNMLSRGGDKGRLEAISQVGQVLALDLIMNNGDRIPFAHRSDDNTTTAIVRPKGRRKYLKLVQEIRELVYESDLSNLDSMFRTSFREDINGMRGVLEFFRLYFEIELSKKEKEALIAGFRTAIDTTLEMYRENTNIFRELKDQTAQAFQDDNGGTHLMAQEGLKTIDPAFYEEVVSCFDL